MQFCCCCGPQVGLSNNCALIGVGTPRDSIQMLRSLILANLASSSRRRNGPSRLCRGQKSPNQQQVEEDFNFRIFFSCLFFSNCVESRHRTSSFMLLSKISESRSAPMNLEIIQCRKHVFPADPEGIFPRTKDRRVQAALPYQQQAVVHIGVKYKKSAI